MTPEEEEVEVTEVLLPVEEEELVLMAVDGYACWRCVGRDDLGGSSGARAAAGGNFPEHLPQLTDAEDGGKLQTAVQRGHRARCIVSVV